MESSLAKALDPDVPFFKDDPKRQGLNITDDDVYKLGQKLDTARKFNGTRQSAQSIAYLTYGFLGSQLGCKTLQRIYSQGSSSEMPRNVTSSRKKYGSLDTQRSISSQQFNNSSLPTTNAIETMQAQVQFNRFCVYARNPTVSDDLNINDKDTDTQGLTPACYASHIIVSFLLQLKHSVAELPTVENEVSILTRIAYYDYLIFEQLKHLVYKKFWGNNSKMSPQLTQLNNMVQKFFNRDSGTFDGIAEVLIGARPEK